MEEVMTKIEANVNKMEENIMTLKRRKFQRDLQDYIKGEVYTWAQNKPRSILKSSKRGHYNRRRSFSNSKVRFPSLNTSAETSAISSSDEHMGATASTPKDQTMKAQGAIPKQSFNQQQKKTSSKNGGEVASNIDEERYPRRKGQQKK